MYIIIYIWFSKTIVSFWTNKRNLSHRKFCLCHLTRISVQWFKKFKSLHYCRIHNSLNFLINYKSILICTTEWAFKLLLCANLFKQTEHSNGFSPVWILSCRRNAAGVGKPFPQNLHWCFFADPVLSSVAENWSPYDEYPYCPTENVRSYWLIDWFVDFNNTLNQKGYDCVKWLGLWWISQNYNNSGIIGSETFHNC